MGTRRSRHNKGRKPLYKEIERDSVRNWDFEVRPRPEKTVPIVKSNYAAPKTGKAIKLIAEVQQYLEARKARELPAKVDYSSDDINAFSFIEGTHNHIMASERDAVLQLFMERKLSAGQVYAARRWQQVMERATLQPNMSIDWSQRVSRMPYQSRGTVTASQWNAMKIRTEFRNQHGPSLLGLLDYCLEPDRSRGELIRSFRTNDAELVKLFDDLLGKVGFCLDLKITVGRRNHYWRAAA